ncbi:MAG: class I tRNA ligase family protein [Bacteroides sp.]|nr:class I tRNA ligase family protein [Eubacterium sp.]MCM1417742.1 class I tRNA ligase family protein [Roseburia sp.]MCM1461367.1 class I tRNA ligase family protein [Bacteroides sp.]
MNEEKKDFKREIPRPEFPKRAVVTGGMPYGNKELHFGHIGGVFVFADVYARFLRDRIGEENVIFVSGTDCYGSPIAEGYRKLLAEGKFEGTIRDFVEKNHKAQKKTLDDYLISPNVFGASGLGRTAELHDLVSDRFIRRLYENGHLKKITTKQFYDEKAGCFLNGRQVVGKCPVDGCNSEKGYADECDLGHQYMPENLVDPKSTLTGETPVMKDVENWYFDLPSYREAMKAYTEKISREKNVRPLVSKTIDEFLQPPVIHIKNELFANYEAVKAQLPAHEYLEEKKKPSFTLVFAELDEMNRACAILSANGIRFRTGKTLVPFRLTGNIEWGVKAPVLEGEEPLTVWVWPESLWAPISFTAAALEAQGRDKALVKDFWCSKDARVYQFIGADNIYFYGVAEMAMFMGLKGGEAEIDPPEGEIQLPTLCANHHILFLDKKASSSGAVKPPMAAELLDYYTAEQLRMHFLGLGLGQRSVSFQPKPLNPTANPDEPDPVLKDGFLLSNVFNRMIRTCFYTVQKHYGGKMPVGEIDEPILADAKKAILDYERFLYRFEFHQATYVLDSYIRKASKYMAKNLVEADKTEDGDLRRHTLIQVFHMIRTAAVLLHPMAPKGTEMLLEYLRLDRSFWSWERIFEPLAAFTGGADHELKFLEPRVDFFTRHPSQFASEEK